MEINIQHIQNENGGRFYISERYKSLTELRYRLLKKK